MDIRKLLAPRSIAVVGATEKGWFGDRTCRNILENMSDLEHVYFINPKGGLVHGRQCLTSISQIPEPLDLAIVCTPRESIPQVLREAAAHGAGGAVVYASGYAETGAEGAVFEEEIKHLCASLDMALMGPNCGGFINFVDNVQAFGFVYEKRDRRGSVGFISQSGQMCLSTIDSPLMRFSYSISAGNCAVVHVEDYLDYLVDDEQTNVVAMYLEGISRPEVFIAALRKAALKRKPVVILKAGRSEKGVRVASSHTGSLAGSDEVYDAIFRKFGVIRVNDLQELLSTAMLFATLPHLPGKAAFGAINLSGGETAICADLGEAHGIVYPDIQPETVETLRGMLPFYASPSNPLDATAGIAYSKDAYAGALRAMLQDPGIEMVIVGFTLQLHISDPAIHHITDGIELVLSEKNTTKPVCMLPFLENTRNQACRERLETLGVPVLPVGEYGFSVLRRLADFVEYNPQEHLLDVAVPSHTSNAGTRTLLSEVASMEKLKAYGVPVPDGGVATTAAAAVELAERLGYPVVLKVVSADVPHKSDAGGVRLNLASAEAVREAFAGIMSSVGTYAPQAVIDGVFVQTMLSKGLEVIVGMIRDPQFGPAVLCGLGGVFVEIFHDATLLSVPFSKDEAMQALQRLQSYPLFDGYRGAEKADIEALADVMTRIGDFARDHADTLLEMDINPLMVWPKGRGACAADALMVLGSA